MQNSDQKVVKQFREAMRLAQLCMAQQPGLPDGAAVHSLACAFITAGVAKGGNGNYSTDRAGADKDQDAMLEDAYGEGSNV